MKLTDMDSGTTFAGQGTIGSYYAAAVAAFFEEITTCFWIVNAFLEKNTDFQYKESRKN